MQDWPLSLRIGPARGGVSPWAPVRRGPPLAPRCCPALPWAGPGSRGCGVTRVPARDGAGVQVPAAHFVRVRRAGVPFVGRRPAFPLPAVPPRRVCSLRGYRGPVSAAATGVAGSRVIRRRPLP